MQWEAADDPQIQSPSNGERDKTNAHRGLLHGHDHHVRVLHPVHPQMSENNLKPLAEETDVETLRAAIAEYQWLAKTLFKSLGCGCYGGHDLCYNCTQAERHYKHTTETYK